MAKIEELVKNEEFVKKIAQVETDEEVRKLFKEEEIDLTDEELNEFVNGWNAKIEDGDNELTEDSLSAVSGGSVLAGLAIMAGGAALLVVGGHKIKHVLNDASCAAGNGQAFDGKHWTCK